MKRNKKFYGLIGGVMALALATPFIAYNVAKADTLYSDVIAWYDFDNSSLKNQKGSDNAKAIVTGLSGYDKELTYGDDRSADNTEGHALKIGDYGLELNEDNLGDNFSVSYWVKPDGTFNENQVIAFLGYNSPEDWYAISGKSNGTNDVKIWCRNPKNSSFNGWITKGTSTLAKGQWHHIVITGDGTTHSTYIDGKLVVQSDFTNVLSGENQDIYLGVNFWDEECTGYIDDVLVYNRTISSGEVERLYTGQTAEQLLEENEISVSDMHTSIGRSAALEVNVPEAVVEDAKLSYSVEDKDIATVDEDGVVTGVAAGSTTVTVEAKIGKTVKSATANIVVESSLNSYLLADYSFDNDYEDATGKTSASLITTKLADYTGDASYTEGVEGKAIALDSYGLDLNLKNVGENYTISFYAKPNSGQAENQVMLFLGNNNPELWTAISSTGKDGVYKLWANTAAEAKTTGNVSPMAWTTLLSPEITTGEWSLVTLVGTDGTITAYVDGICIGSGNNNNPLSGDNQDVLFGVNYWDKCFDGAFDEVKIYSLSMTQDEIINENKEFIASKIQSKLEAVAGLDDILGDNTSADEIKYNLNLPLVVGDKGITWTTSDEDIIAADGTVVNPKKDTEVTVTGTIALTDDIGASVSYDLTVLSLDRTELDALIKVAEGYDLKYATSTSAERLKAAIKSAKDANTFDSIDDCYEKLEKAMAGIEYEDGYADPFELISEATVSVDIVEKKTATVFVIPEAVLSMVDVEYSSEDTSVCTYSDGVIKAKKAGATIVTATVTAKSDGYEMQYSTAVNVTSKDESAAGGSSQGGSNSGTTGGNESAGDSSNTGGSSDSSRSSGSSSSVSSSSSSSSSGSSSSSSSSSASTGTGSSSSAVTSGSTAATSTEGTTANAGIGANAGNAASVGNVGDANHNAGVSNDTESVTESAAVNKEANNDSSTVDNSKDNQTIDEEQTPTTAHKTKDNSKALFMIPIVIVLAAVLLVVARKFWFKKIK